MRISIWVPNSKDYTQIISFLRGELNQSNNIKSKDTRNSTINGLQTAIRNIKVGSYLLIEDNEFVLKTYDGKEFKYKCGREYEIPDTTAKFT